MRKSIISIVLVLCLLFSTASVFAATPGNIYMITIDGEDYTFAVIENETERDVRVYTNNGVLVEHMRYNEETGIMHDVLRDIRHEMQFSLDLLAHDLGDTDSEGYRFMGEYVVDLGQVYSILSISTMCITYGTTISTANSIKTAAQIIIESDYHEWVLKFNMVGATIEEYLELVGPTIEVQGELWMKTDNTYDYSKKIDTFYYVALAAEKYLGGPYTSRQQKRNDI